MLSKFPSLPFHPLLLAILPVVLLLAENIEQISVSDSWRALVTLLMGTALLLVVLKIVLKNGHKAAGVTSLLIVSFFSYGHVYAFLQETTLTGVPLGRHLYLAPVWVAVLALGVWTLNRKRVDLPLMTRTINVIAFLALVFPMFRLGVFFYHNRMPRFGPRVEESDPGPKILIDLPVSPPDIYHIILDGHARADDLKNRFDHDNTPFTRFLENRGFIVAQQSMSNYLWTRLSLASTLNLNYLQMMGLRERHGGFRSQTYDLITNSLARRTLERAGYVTVSLASGFEPSAWRGADYFLSSGKGGTDRPRTGVGVNEFESLLLHTSAVKIILDGDLLHESAWAMQLLNHPFSLHRQTVSGALDNLQRIPALPGPKYVYAHILSPHRPYVFDEHGDAVASGAPFLFASPGLGLEEEMALYRAQLIYLDSEVAEAIEAILTRSETRPIIVVQSDHGPKIGFHWEQPDRQGVFNRAAILNAYYLPEPCRSSIYPGITPVNSYRVIFDCVFGTSLGPIEDLTFVDDGGHWLSGNWPTFTELKEFHRPSGNGASVLPGSKNADWSEQSSVGNER